MCTDSWVCRGGVLLLTVAFVVYLALGEFRQAVLWLLGIRRGLGLADPTYPSLPTFVKCNSAALVIATTTVP